MPVVAVSVEQYDGYVYDFTTTAGAFTVSGIVARNCARSFSGRPDIASQSAADRAKRTGGEGQALAAAEEEARAKAAPVTLSGNARGGRAARVPRSARG